jgi:hypothetical protein
METLDRLRWRRQGLAQGVVAARGFRDAHDRILKVMYTMGFPRYALTQLVAQVT